jgi:hypothetical protein
LHPGGRHRGGSGCGFSATTVPILAVVMVAMRALEVYQSISPTRSNPLDDRAVDRTSRLRAGETAVS